MAAYAGLPFQAGRVPNERIATAVRTTASSAFTSEAIVHTLMFLAEANITYQLRFIGTFNSNVTGDRIVAALREDDLAGNMLTQRQIIDHTSGELFWPVELNVEFSSPISTIQTIVATGRRISGTGNISLMAASDNPALLWAQYLRS